jgi:hypothetical protein
MPDDDLMRLLRSARNDTPYAQFIKVAHYSYYNLFLYP